VRLHWPRNCAWGERTQGSEHATTQPTCNEGHACLQGGVALTLLDSLDALLLFGLEDEFRAALPLVAQHVHFNVSARVHVFEVTIRSQPPPSTEPAESANKAACCGAASCNAQSLQNLQPADHNCDNHWNHRPCSKCTAAP
jgi:Glycosyl hydrolase family 47